jgi:NAD(P)-dependent dehydrogenase (short-subunit alcohol dehydrogenase family)
MSDLFDVSKETILMTGASQGLGRQFARVLAAHGAAVALAARQTGKLKSLEEEIRGKGGRAGALTLRPISVGMIEASTTRKPSKPCSFSFGSTTAIASVPILQVREWSSTSAMPK